MRPAPLNTAHQRLVGSIAADDNPTWSLALAATDLAGIVPFDQCPIATIAPESAQRQLGVWSRSWLGQALTCLAANAGRVSPPGTTAQIRTWRDNREARIAVVDYGRGLTPGDAMATFDWIDRTDDD